MAAWTRKSVPAYADRKEFEYFQQDQAGKKYNCDHIVSTIKISPTRALVIGAYDVGRAVPLDLATVKPPESLVEGYANWRDAPADAKKPPFRYELTPNDVLKHLEKRVVIDVPNRGMKLNDIDRAVVELRDAGSIGPCPDYDDLDVSLATLLEVFKNPSSNPEWKERLSSVGGIYLMTDYANNKLYVGKTDAKQGFWSRWEAYAKQRSGNKLVDPAFKDGRLLLSLTRMSILAVVPRASATEAVIEKHEHRWMNRLRTRVTGYNN